MPFDLPGTAHTRAAIAIAMMLTLTACGDDAGGTGSGDAGGSDTAGSMAGAGGSGGEGQGGAGQGGGGGDEAVDPATLPDAGFIQLFQVAGQQAEVGVRFQRGRPTVDPDGDRECETRTEGTCTATRCNGLSSPPDSTTYLDAGAIAVTGALQEVSLERDEGGRYGWTDSGPLFTSTSTVLVEGAGAEVPGFGVDVPVPPRLTDLGPTFEDMVVPAGDDLTLSWSLEGSGGSTYLWVVTAFDETTFDDVACSFEADAGGGRVPAGLLDWLEAESFHSLIWTAAETHVAIGSHDVLVSAVDAIEGAGRIE